MCATDATVQYRDGVLASRNEHVHRNGFAVAKFLIESDPPGHQGGIKIICSFPISVALACRCASNVLPSPFLLLSGRVYISETAGMP